MKKNIEWLKSAIQQNLDFYNDNDEEWQMAKVRAYAKSLDLINQLDEPEVLSQEWISEHMYYVDDSDSSMVYVSDLQNLLVPKQELSVIPKFVAYVIEAYKSNSRLTNLLADLAFHGELAEFVEHEDEDEVFEWARSNRKATDEILARAWLDGFTVEEEQKYYVINKQGAFALRKDTGGVANSIYTKKEVERLGELQYYQLTEQEVKDYDERYWPFAVKVEELEE